MYNRDIAELQFWVKTRMIFMVLVLWFYDNWNYILQIFFFNLISGCIRMSLSYCCWRQKDKTSRPWSNAWIVAWCWWNTETSKRGTSIFIIALKKELRWTKLISQIQMRRDDFPMLHKHVSWKEAVYHITNRSSWPVFYSWVNFDAIMAKNSFLYWNKR